MGPRRAPAHLPRCLSGWRLDILPAKPQYFSAELIPGGVAARLLALGAVPAARATQGLPHPICLRRAAAPASSKRGDP